MYITPISEDQQKSSQVWNKNKLQRKKLSLGAGLSIGRTEVSESYDHWSNLCILISGEPEKSKIRIDQSFKVQE
jgi:hypothetical protein